MPRNSNDDHHNPNRERDDDGRFTSGAGSRSARDGDDEGNVSRASSGQGRGWHGDSQGHTEAGRHSHDSTRGTDHTRDSDRMSGRPQASLRQDEDGRDYRPSGRQRDDEGRFAAGSRNGDYREDEDREFNDWHAYGHARGWHAHQQGRHARANQTVAGQTLSGTRNDRDRDSEGRLTSGARSSGASPRNYDDDGHGNRSRGTSDRERDENGRFSGNRH
jgi:hypothetical protein